MNSSKSTKLTTVEKGRRTEAAAIKYLEDQGLVYVTKNFHGRYGEIDIIMKDDDVIVFVEVKYRKNLRFDSGSYAVDYRKQKKIYYTAMEYLKKNRLTHKEMRFDIIDILANNIEWTQDAIWGDSFEF